MTTLYDGSYQDVANRLRDDELISLKLVNNAADMIMRYGDALKEIVDGYNYYNGSAEYFAKIAIRALHNEENT